MDSSKNNIDNGLDVLDLMELIYEKKIKIFLITSFFALVSIVISLNVDNRYQSSSTLYQNEMQNQGNASDIGSIASIVGLSDSQQTSSVDFAKEIVFSRFLINELLKEEDMLIKLMATKSYDLNTNAITFNKKIYDADKKSWTIKNKNGQAAPPSIQQIQNRYNKIVTFTHNKDSGFVSLDVIHKSPIFAFDLLTFIIEKLNSKARSRAIIEAEKSLFFLENKLKTTTQYELRDSLSQLITNQLDRAMIANVEYEYLLKVLDEPFVPEKKASPNRTLIVIITTLMGFVIAIFSIVFSSLIEQRKPVN